MRERNELRGRQMADDKENLPCAHIEAPASKYCVLRASVLADQTSSGWLRRAIESLEPRDPVDAANDLEVLSHLTDMRCTEALSATRSQAEQTS